MSYKNLLSLEAYKQGVGLRIAIRDLTTTFPSSEKYELTKQIIRASRSVPANISEGHGRFHFQENIQFCRISRGSLYEILDHLSVAQEEKYITDDIFAEHIKNVEQCIRIFNGYINFLKSKKLNK